MISSSQILFNILLISFGHTETHIHTRARAQNSVLSSKMKMYTAQGIWIHYTFLRIHISSIQASLIINYPAIKSPRSEIFLLLLENVQSKSSVVRSLKVPLMFKHLLPSVLGINNEAKNDLVPGIA